MTPWQRECVGMIEGVCVCVCVCVCVHAEKGFSFGS